MTLRATKLFVVLSGLLLAGTASSFAPMTTDGR